MLSRKSNKDICMPRASSPQSFFLPFGIRVNRAQSSVRESKSDKHISNTSAKKTVAQIFCFYDDDSENSFSVNIQKWKTLFVIRQSHNETSNFKLLLLHTRKNVICCVVARLALPQLCKYGGILLYVHWMEWVNYIRIISVTRNGKRRCCY